MAIALAVTIIAQIAGQYTAKAAWSAVVGWEGYDAYTICYHTALGTPQDRCVGLGVEAHYDKYSPGPPPYDYKYAKWIFNANLGYAGSKTWNFWPNDNQPAQADYCWAKYNGIWGEYIFYADSTPSWLDGQWTIRDNYPDSGLAELNPHATSICARVSQYFVLPGQPGTVTSLSITLQPFDRVTACAGPPQNYSGPAYLD